jgi:hypothetical protein
MSRACRAAVFVCLMGMIAISSTWADDGSSLAKAPVPDAGSRDRSESLIRETYGARLAAARTPDAKAALAADLLKFAAEAEGDAARYVLLHKALEVAADGGDVSDGIEAIDATTKAFNVDFWSFITESLRPLAQSVRDVEGQRALIERIEKYTEQAIGGDQYPVAAKLAGIAEICGMRSHDAGVKSRAATLQREVGEIQAAYTAQKSAAHQPPAEANLAKGRFECFLKGDWARGLPLLAASSDAKLAAIAKSDLGNPADADTRLQVADGWWETAATEHGVAVRRLRERAVFYYRRAAPDLNGLPGLRANKRISEAEAAAPKPPQLPELVIEALIDGNSFLHVTPTGIYWEERGVAKPGRHEGANEPTAVNGQPWMPKWGDPTRARGNDQSALLPLPIGKLDFDLQVLAVGKLPGGNEIEKRDPVTIYAGDNEQIVSIPDHQIDARWYRIRLFRKKPSGS